MRSIEHVKRYTTTGMATDQGKLSNMNALAIVPRALDQPAPAVGLTTFRQPYTPVSFGSFAGASRGDLFDPVRRTPIHDWAAENGAAFEDVGLWKRAWCFPKTGEDMHAAVARECTATRASLGMFDASTLGKIEVVGPDAATFLERLYANSWKKLEVGRCRYGLMLNEQGFIMDDGVVARMASDRFHVTTTTGGIDLSRESMPHMSVREGLVCGLPMRLMRVSFTGELGFELNVPPDYVRAVWEALWSAGRAYGCVVYGTEAMHVMRAEKGYIIVGQDTDGTVTPADAGLEWDRQSEEGFRRQMLAGTARNDGPKSQAACRAARRGSGRGARGGRTDHLDRRSEARRARIRPCHFGLL